MAVVRQGAWFLMIGALQVLADWLCFVGLSAMGVGVVPANLTSRIGVAFLGFWLNGRLTFAEQGRARLGGRRMLRYLASLAVFTLLSTLLLDQVASRLSLSSAWLAKPVVECCMAVMSFFVARHWIYR